MINPKILEKEKRIQNKKINKENFYIPFSQKIKVFKYLKKNIYNHKKNF